MGASSRITIEFGRLFIPKIAGKPVKDRIDVVTDVGKNGIEFLVATITIGKIPIISLLSGGKTARPENIYKLLPKKMKPKEIIAAYIQGYRQYGREPNKSLQLEINKAAKRKSRTLKFPQ